MQRIVFGQNLTLKTVFLLSVAIPGSVLPPELVPGPGSPRDPVSSGHPDEMRVGILICTQDAGGGQEGALCVVEPNIPAYFLDFDLIWKCYLLILIISTQVV